MVSDRKLLDITKLPSRSFIEEIYRMDSQINEKRISLIGEGYERKIELFRAFQLGEDLHKIKLVIKDYRKPTINTEEFVIKNEGKSKGNTGMVRHRKGRQQELT